MRLEPDEMLKYLFAKPTGVSSDPRWLDVPEGAKVFTYHQKHAGQILLGGLILAAIVEAQADAGVGARRGILGQKGEGGRCFDPRGDRRGARGAIYQAFPGCLRDA